MAGTGCEGVSDGSGVQPIGRPTLPGVVTGCQPLLGTARLGVRAVCGDRWGSPTREFARSWNPGIPTGT